MSVPTSGVTTTRHGPWSVLSATGELDLATRAQLSAALELACAYVEPRIVLDLTEATFWDCVTIGALVSAQRVSGCNLSLVINRPELRRLLHHTGLAERFQTFSTLDDPLSSD